MESNGEHDFFVQWHLTERCNLRCRHCYQRGSGSDELTPAEARDVVEEVADTLDGWRRDHGVEVAGSFSVTGGEPLLRADLWGLLAEMRDRGFETFLLTNGTLVDAAAAGRLADLGVAGVQVSLEGPEEVHDGVRGAGSFARAARGVRSLRDADLRVTLNMTLSRLTAPAALAMAAVARELGVDRLGFARLVPWGRGEALLRELIEPEDLRALYRDLLAAGGEGLEIVTGDPLASQLATGWAGDGGGEASGGCAAGVSGITIGADGTLLPCRRLDVPLGNLRRDSLREVWATSPVLARLRDRRAYPGACGTCPRWSGCRGCRAVAYAVSAADGAPDYLADDPQCFLRGS